MHDYAIDSRERVFVVRILFMASALVSGIAAVFIPSDDLAAALGQIDYGGSLVVAAPARGFHRVGVRLR